MRDHLNTLMTLGGDGIVTGWQVPRVFCVMTVNLIGDRHGLKQEFWSIQWGCQVSRSLWTLWAERLNETALGDGTCQSGWPIIGRLLYLFSTSLHSGWLIQGRLQLIAGQTDLIEDLRVRFDFESVFASFNRIPL